MSAVQPTDQRRAMYEWVLQGASPYSLDSAADERLWIAISNAFDNWREDVSGQARALEVRENCGELGRKIAKKARSRGLAESANIKEAILEDVLAFLCPPDFYPFC